MHQVEFAVIDRASQMKQFQVLQYLGRQRFAQALPNVCHIVRVGVLHPNGRPRPATMLWPELKSLTCSARRDLFNGAVDLALLQILIAKGALGVTVPQQDQLVGVIRGQRFNTGDFPGRIQRSHHMAACGLCVHPALRLAVFVGARR